MPDSMPEEPIRSSRFRTGTAYLDHIAFGASYPGTTESGTRLSKDELLARGMNQSAIHEDVMVGAEDSHITGKCRDGHTVDLFRDGVWVL